MESQRRAARRVFLTGATGAIGLEATRALVATGHTVIGVTRSRAGGAALSRLGATPVEVDLFDRDAVGRAVAGSDVVAHFATSIPTGNDATKLGNWALNDRLRGLGTSNLVLGAERAGVPRVIFESISLAYPDHGDAWIDESTALSAVAPMMQSAIDAEAMVARFGERGGEAVSLRFGRLYGPGRASEAMIEAIQGRQMPIVGRGDNFVSSIHVEDAGRAVANAVDVSAGVYNVVDDEPVTQREWMEAAVSALSGPQPRRVLYPMARVFAGKAARVLHVSQRVSNRRFRAAGDWTPRYRSVLEGFATLQTGAPDPIVAASPP